MRRRSTAADTPRLSARGVPLIRIFLSCLLPPAAASTVLELLNENINEQTDSSEANLCKSYLSACANPSSEVLVKMFSGEDRTASVRGQVPRTMVPVTRTQAESINKSIVYSTTGLCHASENGRCVSRLPGRGGAGCGVGRQTRRRRRRRRWSLSGFAPRGGLGS